MSITILQLHKRASYDFKNIQDKCAINHNTKSFALADGTTQSFNSEIWAEIITKDFVSNPSFNANILLKSFQKRVSDYKNVDFNFSSNPAKASLEKAKANKGGTATFIGFQLNNNKIDVISCGDSNLFLLNEEGKIRTFPFSDLDSLDSNNQFINTEQLILEKIDDTFFKQTRLEVKENDIIILATDAISRLILKKPETISELLKIQKFDDLHHFCIKKWEHKELEEDDISVIIIPVAHNNQVKYIVPPDNFSFPKEKEVEFIPTDKEQKKIKYTDMEMDEFRTQFNGIAQDFYQVKNKLKLHEILLMSTISLLLVNILLMYFLRPMNYKNEISIEKLKHQRIEQQKKENSHLQKENPTISKDEVKKKQEELIKAGYKVTADGIWGTQSEKNWNDYKQKKKVKK